MIEWQSPEQFYNLTQHEFVYLVPPTFNLASPRIQIPFMAYVALFVVGTVGNVWVAIVVGRLVKNWMGKSVDTLTGRGGNRALHVYILGLCSLDLWTLFFLPLLLLDMVYSQWTIPSSFLCKLFLTSDCLVKFGAPLILTALSAYCYFTICRGTQFLGSKNQIDLSSGRFALCLVAACVFVVLVLSMPMWLYGSVQFLVYEINNTKKAKVKCNSELAGTWDTTFIIYSCLFGYVLPAVSFTYFYSAILYHVHGHAKRMRGDSRKARYFWQTAKTSVCFVAFYFVCWTPYYGTNLYIQFAGSSSVNSTAVSILLIVHTLPYINCCGYPILYTVLNRNIKDEYNRVTQRSRAKRERSRQFNASSWVAKSSGVREPSLPNWSNRSNSQSTIHKDRSPPLQLREDGIESIEMD